jgi:hypothetical protein
VGRTRAQSSGHQNGCRPDAVAGSAAVRAGFHSTGPASGRERSVSPAFATDPLRRHVSRPRKDGVLWLERLTK